jgi:hypothetical protein
MDVRALARRMQALTCSGIMKARPAATRLAGYWPARSPVGS